MLIANLVLDSQASITLHTYIYKCIQDNSVDWHMERDIPHVYKSLQKLQLNIIFYVHFYHRDRKIFAWKECNSV